MPESELDSELRRSAERTLESIRAEASLEADRLATEADRANGLQGPFCAATQLAVELRFRHLYLSLLLA